MLRRVAETEMRADANLFYPLVVHFYKDPATAKTWLVADFNSVFRGQSANES